MPKAHAEAFGGGAAALELANPIAADLSDMRPSLIPGLAAAIGRNAARGFHDLALFEVGQIFKGSRPEDQFTAATAVRSGTAKPGGSGRHWSGPANGVEMFDAKADAFALLAALGFAPGNAQIAAGGAPYLHPGRSGTLKLGNAVLGHFGELHPATLDLLGLDGPVVAAEILLDRIPAAKAKPTKAKPPLDKSDLQPVTRDFAFLVGERVAAADIVRAAQTADRKLVSRVSVFDVYAGQGVEPGKKSLAIEVMLQPRERTLTDAEIDAVAASIVAAVGKATGAILRG
jgi:phenylalanyl-tRNA synthetase beta chain